MFYRKYSFPLPVVAATLMIFLSFLSPVASFTIVTPSRVIPTHNVAHPIPISATTTLLSSREIHPIIGGRSPSHAKSTTTALLMNFSPPDKADTGGLERGKYILILAMFLNVWLFSIPPEFRRARLCNDEDVRLHPEKNCTTFAAWRKGVAEYYANGGGVKFDFSIEGKE